MTKMGSIDVHRIDYNKGRGSERPATHTQQKLTKNPPPPVSYSRTDFIFSAERPTVTLRRGGVIK